MNKHYFIFKAYTFLLIGLFSINCLSAQDAKKVEDTDISEFMQYKHVFRIGLPYPTFTSEFRLYNTLTMSVGGLLGVNFESVNGVVTNSEVFPIVVTSLQQYVNVKRRVGKGKRVDKFSANYVGISAAYQFSASNPLFVMGANYGLNRNIGRSGFVGLSAGVNIITDGVETGGRPALGFSIGFSFPQADEKYKMSVSKSKK